jgi:hypothetical protein
MTIASTIMNTLNSRLAQLSSLPPTAWPNVPFIPTTGTPWIRVDLLPADSALETIQGSEEHLGVYQVSVFAPLDKGTSAALVQADVIADHFAADRDLSGLRIRSISVGQPMREESWLMVPVSIEYRVHHTR